MKKIIAIIGARPQFIKHAPIELSFKKQFIVQSIHTGQHYDKNMSDVFFDQLGIMKPQYMLSIGSASHGVQTGKMLIEIEPILEREQPDAILVYGDTNSTLAGAIAGSKLNIPIIHLESGLRSFNQEMPEEINRVLTDHISSLLLAPTQNAVKNLKNEGIENGVHFTGDVMCDMLRIAERVIGKNKNQKKEYYYATIHRPYNTDDELRLKEILTVLNSLNKKVIFSRHPRTRSKMADLKLHDDFFSKIKFIDPVSYFDNIELILNSCALITDSGGMQKEAYMLKKKCVTIRKETEWIETLEGGWNTLVFNNLTNLQEVLNDNPTQYQHNIYGDGKAADQIKGIVLSFMDNL